MPATIGQMNKLITIQQKSVVEDETGQPQESWGEFLAPVWAAVEPLSSKEIFAAAQAGVIGTHRVTIWYRVEVEAAASLLRILYTRDGSVRVLNAISGTPVSDSKGRQLELICAEVQPWANQS